MAKWLVGTILALTFGLTLWVLVAATATVLPLGPADRSVMEEYLRRDGYEGVYVLSGFLCYTCAAYSDLHAIGALIGDALISNYPMGNQNNFLSGDIRAIISRLEKSILQAVVLQLHSMCKK